MKKLFIILFLALCISGYGQQGSSSILKSGSRNTSIGILSLTNDSTPMRMEFQRSRSDGSMTIFKGKKADTCYCVDMAATVMYCRSLEGIKKPIVFLPPMSNGEIPVQQNITGNTNIAYGDSAMPHNHYTSTGLRIIYNVIGEDLAYTHYDTLSAILIYIDTSADIYQTAGYFSGIKKDSADMINFLYDRNTHWMKGYKVTAPLLIHGEYWSTTVIEYLDEKKGKLPKNIIVIK